MFRLLMAAGLALSIWMPNSVRAAETINVVIMQEDDDKDSLERDSRIQRAVLNAFNQALQAPAASDIYRKYGIGGMDVYDEKALTMSFDKQGRTRREDTELISVARDIRNPRIDVLVLYTLYAKAVKAPYGDYVKLQMAMNYRALDVRSGRVLGGDNLDLNQDGEPMTGCAAAVGQSTPDRHCVKEFVAEKAERLVRDAGNTLATQLAALSHGFGKGGNQDVAAGDDRPGPDCETRPQSYLITFRNVTAGDMRQIVKRMKEWSCAIDLGLENSSASEASYTYKVRATDVLLKRNLEITMDHLGLQGGVETRGSNELLVKAIPIRKD